MSNIPRYLEKYFLSTLVRDLGPQPSARVQSSATLQSVARVMSERKLSLVFVAMPNGRDAIFTERDLVRQLVAEGDAAYAGPIEQYASQPIEYISARASLARVLYMMTTAKFRHLPLTAIKDDEIPAYISTLPVMRFVYERLAKQTMQLSQDMKQMENAVQELLALPISELKPSPPKTFSSATTLSETIGTMEREGIGSALVVEGERLVGIATERDIVAKVAVHAVPLKQAKLGEYMTKNPVTVAQGLSLAYAFEVLSSGEFRHLPVVDSLDTLVGVLSVRNFIHALSDEVFQSIEKGVKKPQM